MIRSLLAHPLTRGIDLDDPRTTQLRRQILRSKPFLRQVYKDWYRLLAARVPEGGCIVELGSGAGFIREFIPGITTTEVFPCEGADMVVDAQRMPFAAGGLGCIVMIDVLHHLPDCRAFFREATRCVRSGGAVLMIEPWNTPWARFVYRRLHSEPFEPSADWTIPATSPLSGANGALPWIIFGRDADRFAAEFPAWEVRTIQPFMPLAYLASGGVSMRSIVPGLAYSAVRGLESMLGSERWGMFALIDLRRRREA